MHLLDVTIERVIESHRLSTKGRIWTEVSFVGNGEPHFAVKLPGHTSITEGELLTFALERTNDWQSLKGARNWTTGELAIPSPVNTLLAAAVLTVLGLPVLNSFFNVNVPQVFPMWLCVICALFAPALVMQASSELKVVRLLRGMPKPTAITRTGNNAG